MTNKGLIRTIESYFLQWALTFFLKLFLDCFASIESAFKTVPDLCHQLTVVYLCISEMNC